jgi:L-ascorbate metabolism protein UlaG (beta-lactamase superfamily)
MSTLKVTFLGTTSFLFDDGEDAFLLDGYLSRPSLWSIFLRNLEPDYAKIKQFINDRPSLENRLRYVAVAHSHIDHVLDAPVFAKETTATLAGSRSTRNVAQGYGLSDSRIEEVEDQGQLCFGANGKVTITMITCEHSPGDTYPGVVTEPLQLPAPASAFKTGLCYSFHIRWGSQKIFVHPSANFVPGKFAGFKADTLFLGIGGLGKQTDDFHCHYWEETVGTIEPKLIVPIHWDAFWRPLESPLTPAWWPLDNFARAKKFLDTQCREGSIKLQFPEGYEEFDFGIA